MNELSADDWRIFSRPLVTAKYPSAFTFTPLPPGHGCWGMIADQQLDPGLPSLTQCNNPHPPTLHCRTPLIPQPFTLSPSFAPTAPFSTRSCSTATGGKYRPPRPAPPAPACSSSPCLGSTWTARQARVSTPPLRARLAPLAGVRSTREGTLGAARPPSRSARTSAPARSPPAGAPASGTPTAPAMDSAA